MQEMNDLDNTSGHVVWVCGNLLAGTVSSNPAEGRDVSISCEVFMCVCVLSGRGPCDGLITHSEKSYQMSCV